MRCAEYVFSFDVTVGDLKLFSTRERGFSAGLREGEREGKEKKRTPRSRARDKPVRSWNAIQRFSIEVKKGRVLFILVRRHLTRH